MTPKTDSPRQNRIWYLEYVILFFPIKNLSLLLNLLVTGIGVYMVLVFMSVAVPPVLSGVAFVAIGLNGFLNR